MNRDTIAIIAVGNSNELKIYPSRERFEFIWRSATEVHWNPNDNSLFSPKPREWSYADWFLHILSAIYSEYGTQLILNNSTEWNNVPDSIKSELIDAYSKFETFLASSPK